MSISRLLTARALADRLGVSTETVLRWTRRGELPAHRLPGGMIRYYDANGKRRRKSPFPSRSAGLAHYRDVIEPQLRGEAVPMPDLTFGALVPLYLERHAATVRPRTIQTLRERLPHAERAFGTVP